MSADQRRVLVGVLALQGAFSEHIDLLRKAFAALNDGWAWDCEEIRTPEELRRCDALIIPGGESTTMALVAARSGLLDPLRHFVKVDRKPTWGTCAGLILLAEAANRTKKGGQELVGGLDVRVRRNHYGRQVESFEAHVQLSFLDTLSTAGNAQAPFLGVFIRAPVVEKVLPLVDGPQAEEDKQPETIVAPARVARDAAFGSVKDHQVEIMATLPARSRPGQAHDRGASQEDNVVAVKQANCFGTSFHPELTGDARIHIWWLAQVRRAIIEANSATAMR